MSRAATSRLKVNPPLGSPPTLEWRAVGELLIDPVYQRSIDTGPSQSLIRKIAMFWDWGLCQPLAVSRRPDGALTIVDGQHRAAAVKLRGDIPHLPCVITSYANAGDEAAAFVALNQMRRPLTRLDLFKAAVAAEDESALAVMRLLGEAGLQLAPHTNHTAWKPGMVSNIARIQERYRVYGERLTAAALEAVARGFQGLVLRFVGTVFPGIVGFLAEQRKLGNAVSRSRLADALASRAQADWKRLIGEEQARLGCRYQTAAKVAVTNVYERTGGQPTALPPRSRANQAPVVLDAGEIGWCEQCQQKVGGERAAKCTDRFCSMRKAEAA